MKIAIRKAATGLAVSMIMVWAAQPVAAGSCQGSACKSVQTIYVGTRASGDDGGITAARFDPATGMLTLLGKVADIARPTWLMASPRDHVLYAVSEIGNDGKSEGAVASFAAEPGSGKLTPISQVGSGGGGATNLAIGGTPPSVFVANYGTGHVAALPLKPGGRLMPAGSVMADTGKGSDDPRQSGPHAHAVLPDHGGKYLLVADLGADRIFVYRFDAAHHRLSPSAQGFVALPPGSGPRHLAMSNDGRFVYALTEMTSQLVTYRWNAARGQLTQLESVSIERAANRVPGSHAAEVTISRDGRFLYASNRGEDTVVTFALDPRTGKATEVQRLEVGAKYPTALVFDATQNWMFIASPGTNSVGVFARDSATGKLAPTSFGLVVPMAVTVAVLPN